MDPSLYLAPLTHLDRVAFLVLGWLFGLVSPAIVDAIRRRRIHREVYAAVITELNELRYRLACVLYQIAPHTGQWSRQLLLWLQARLEHYDGLYYDDSILVGIRKFLDLDDSQLATVAPSGPFALRLYRLPFLEANADKIGGLSPGVQRQLLEIRQQLDLYNQAAADQDKYLQLTFQDLSEINRPRVEANQRSAYTTASRSCRHLIELIEQLAAIPPFRSRLRPKNALQRMGSALLHVAVGNGGE